jgi:UPF0716 family protein affecting phage T7 exclusion
MFEPPVASSPSARAHKTTANINAPMTVTMEGILLIVPGLATCTNLRY